MGKTCSVCRGPISYDNKSGICAEDQKLAAMARKEHLREEVERMLVHEGLPFKAIAARLGIDIKVAREMTDMRRPGKSRPEARNPVIADIVAIVSDSLGVPIDSIVGEVRKRRFVNARQIVWLIAREQGYSFPEIARSTNRDHSSVVHGRDAIQAKAERDPSLRARIEMVRKRWAKAAPGFSDRVQAPRPAASQRVNADLPLDQAMRNDAMVAASRQFLNALRLAA